MKCDDCIAGYHRETNVLITENFVNNILEKDKNFFNDGSYFLDFHCLRCGTKIDWSKMSDSFIFRKPVTWLCMYCDKEFDSIYFKNCCEECYRKKWQYHEKPEKKPLEKDK